MSTRSMGADAVRLFSDRARAAKNDFALTDRNASAVGVLCRRLDGIPLAIELAAARVRSMSPEDLVSRLDQRFKLLTRGSRAALERHQTLRSTIDWSYDLLEPTERHALDRLSVFAGGCDLAAAEAVLPGTTSTPWMWSTCWVSSSTNRSSSPTTTATAGCVTGCSRRIRQYAQERLQASGDTAAVRRRHADHYVDAGRDRRPPPPEPRPDSSGLEPSHARSTTSAAVLDWAVETAAAPTTRSAWSHRSR